MPPTFQVPLMLEDSRTVEAERQNVVSFARKRGLDVEGEHNCIVPHAEATNKRKR